MQHENRSSLHETLAVWFSLAEAGKRKRVEKSLIRRLLLLVRLFLVPYRSYKIFFVWQSREKIPIIGLFGFSLARTLRVRESNIQDVCILVGLVESGART